jgi:hypothetical protein
MLVDRTHKKWMGATATVGVVAVGVYLFVYRRTPGGLTGGDLVGMAYGLAAAALMAFAGGLSLLRRVPSWWWLGARQTWLRGHIWLGLLSGVLILCHAGGRLGGPLEQALLAVLGLTLLTGIAGLGLQQFLPRLLLQRVPHEAPYEQIPHLCARMRQEADDLLAQVRADPRLEEPVRVTLRAFYDEAVRPFLASAFRRSSPLAGHVPAALLFDEVRRRPGMAALPAALFKKRPDGKWGPEEAGTEESPGRDPLAWLQTYCEERRQLREQERLHHWLHGWLFVHIPLALLLMVLGVAHIFGALYY